MNELKNTYFDFHDFIFGVEWCEIRNGEGKQVRGHLLCGKKLSHFPFIVYSLGAWERKQSRPVWGKTCFIQSLFVIFYCHAVRSPVHIYTCCMWVRFLKAGAIITACFFCFFFTFLCPVSQNCCAFPVDDAHMEHSLHVRLIETRKHSPGACRFQIGGGKKSMNTDEDSHEYRWRQSSFPCQAYAEGTLRNRN